MDILNILLIGSGGREHAIAWRLAQSPYAGQIFVSPGNAGTSEVATNILLALHEPAAVIDFCKQYQIGLVIIGPEAPLVDGVADYLEAAGIAVFGPSKKAAILEASKAFTKDFCKKYQIPSAAYERFTHTEKAAALDYIRNHPLPVVVKADGLAAGKGVVIAHSHAEAEQAVLSMFDGQFGAAGETLVIEEFLQGEELSFFAIVDGKQVVAFGSAQDHKAVGDGDTGPNTGGMGTYSPAPIMTAALEQEMMRDFIIPTVEGMKQEGRMFKGVLFAGFMITDQGPKLLEYNVRFGDPETQCLMARLRTDLVELLYQAATGNLQNTKVELDARAALCVVMAAKGYPGDYQNGTEIRNLAAAASQSDIVIFHAGTRKKEDGTLLASGGRVLGVTAYGKNVTEAQQRAYQAVDTIDWPEGFSRRDIGYRAIAREKTKAAS